MWRVDILDKYGKRSEMGGNIQTFLDLERLVQARFDEIDEMWRTKSSFPQRRGMRRVSFVSFYIDSSSEVMVAMRL